MNRRIKLMTFLIAALVGTVALAGQNGQIPVAASTIPQFAQALPQLSLTQGVGLYTHATDPSILPAPYSGTYTAGAPLDIRMCEFQSQVLPPPAPATWTWGYIIGTSCPLPTDPPRDSYLGPVLVNLAGTPTSILYTNALPTVDQTKVLAYKFSTDQTLMWADPLGADPNPLVKNPPETNACHMGSMDMSDTAMPFTPFIGIPGYRTPCALNFGEDPTLPGGFAAKGIPATPHLHGGEVPPAIDGGPDTWFTSLNGDGTFEHGHDYYTNTSLGAAPTNPNQSLYSYPNLQGQAPLWFHDHTMGATRLNVYAGIAGAYYLLEKNQEAWFSQIGMRPITELVPIVLQDRMFDTNGQFYFPQDFPGGINGPPTNPQHPYWNPEFIGDTIVVNGKAWPFLKVEPRRYRFLFLNGSNARTYEMFFVNPKTKVMGPVMWTIGNDGGILDWPSLIDPNAAKPAEPHFVIMPGERYEIIVDFTNFAGQSLILRNVAKAPYPGGATPQGTTTGQIMKFVVSAAPVADSTYNPAKNTKGTPGAVSLRPTPIVRLTQAGSGTIDPSVKVSKIRQLTLNEVATIVTQTVADPVSGLTQTYPGGPIEILVNNSRYSGESPRSTANNTAGAYNDFTPVTINGITELVSETPKEGDVELWEIINTTADAHPIHTHLATFQILNRQNYNTGANGYFAKAYAPAFPAITGSKVCTGLVYCPSFGPPYDYDTSAAPGKPPLTRTLNALSQNVPVVGGNPDVTPYLSTLLTVPDPDEVGWKDTFLVLPGMVNRMLVRFAPTETPVGVVAGYPFSPNDGTNGALTDSRGYVWHCHIIDHEDNEMMRPDVIVPLAGATRTWVKGVNY